MLEQDTERLIASDEQSVYEFVNYAALYSTLSGVRVEKAAILIQPCSLCESELNMLSMVVTVHTTEINIKVHNDSFSTFKNVFLL